MGSSGSHFILKVRYLPHLKNVTTAEVRASWKICTHPLPLLFLQRFIPISPRFLDHTFELNQIAFDLGRFGDLDEASPGIMSIGMLIPDFLIGC